MRNTNRVPKKQWKKWSSKAKFIFNECYDFYMNNQKTMNHPKAGKLPYLHWKTLSWNAAWIAADACDDSIPIEFVEVN